MNDIFNYLKNSSVDVLPDRGLSKQWHELNMNRNTLGAFLKTRQNAQNAGHEPSYLEKYIEGSTKKPEAADKAFDAKQEPDRNTKAADEEVKAAKKPQTAGREDLTAKKEKDAEKTEERRENYLQKYFRESTKKLSKPNKELSSYSTQAADSVERLESIIDKLGGEDKTEELNEAADNLVGSFNELVKSIRESKNNTVSSKSRFIDDMTNSYSKRLERVGISKNNDGTLSLDKDKLQEASPRDIEKAFGKKDSFASFVDEQAKQLASYAQTDAFQRASAYTNAGNITTVSNINGSFMSMLG